MITEPQVGANTTARGGFTLVEIIVVLGLLSILLGVAIPRIDVTSYRLDAGIREVTTTVRGAQGSAVLRGHDVVVAFDEADRTIRIHSDIDSDGDVDDAEGIRFHALPEGLVFGRASAPARPISADAISFDEEQSGLPAVTFHRNGSATEEGIVYVTSERAAQSSSFAEDARAIEVARSTGRIRCVSYDSGSWQEGC